MLNTYKKNLSWVILFAFVGNVLCSDLAKASVNAYGGNILLFPALTTPYQNAAEPVLKAIAVDAKNPFKIDFVVEGGDQFKDRRIPQEQLEVLMKYFLSFLTIPEKDLWVNLSPYEKNRIIAPELELTNAGKDMLSQDFVLKQMAAALTSPDQKLGKEFWKRVFSRAREVYGIKEIPINSFNKVWVVPAKAVVYEEKGSAYIAQSRLKVLTEADYLGASKSTKDNSKDHFSSDITRSLIIPELEREVNEGPYFASLRQMYHALILAIWFKEKLKKNLVNQIYANRKKTSGIRINEKQVKEHIYAQYLASVKKGVYNLVREDYDPQLQKKVPRKYFSGGFSFAEAAQVISFKPASHLNDPGMVSKAGAKFTLELKPLGMAKAALLGLTFAGALAAATPSHAAQPQELLRLNDAITNPADRQLIASIPQRINLDEELKSMDPQDRDFIRRNINGQGRDIFTNPTYFRWYHQRLLIIAQKKSGITADGVIGPQTREKVGGVQVSAELQLNLTGTTVAAIQPVSFVPPARSERAGDFRPTEVAQGTGVITKVQTVTIAPEDGKVQLASTDLSGIMLAQSGAAPVPSPLSAAERLYLVDGRVRLEPIRVSVNAELKGVPQFIDMNKREYAKGEKIGRIVNVAFEQRLNSARSRLTEAENNLAAKQRIKSALAPAAEITPIQQEIFRIKAEIAELEGQLMVGDIIAPYDLTILDFNTPGVEINAGDAVLTMMPKNRYAFNLNIAPNVTFINGIKDMTLNGVRVSSIPSLRVKVVPNSNDKLELSFTVTTDNPLPLGSWINVKAAFLPSRQIDARLASFIPVEGTYAPVTRVEETAIRAPGAGVKKIYVQEGQVVKAGDVLAIIGNPKLIEEYNRMLDEIAAIDEQLNKVVDLLSGYDGRKTMLDNRKTDLLAKLESLQRQASLSVIRAAQSGIVTAINHQANMVNAGAEVLRMTTGMVYVGGDERDSILIPKRQAVAIGDPVVVKTRYGDLLPGKVLSINPMPHHPDRVVSNDFQSIKVAVIDSNGTIRERELVSVIFPKDERERRQLMAVLSEQEQTRVAGAAAPPDRQVSLPRPRYTSKTVTVRAPAVAIPAAYSPGQAQGGTNYNGLAQLVGANDFMTQIGYNRYLQKYEASRLPTASNLDLNASIGLQDGRIVVGGGIAGTLMNSITAAVGTGNVYGAAIPILTNIFGNIMNLIDGKPLMEQALAQKYAEIAYDEMAVTMLDNFHEATKLWIQIGELDANIDYLNKRIAQAQAALNASTVRQANGMGTVPQVFQNQFNVSAEQAKMVLLQGQRTQLIAQLQAFTGFKVAAVNVPFNANFLTINDEQMARMLAQLLGDNSPNFALQRAKHVAQAGGLSLKLHNLSYLPRVNAGAVNSTTDIRSVVPVNSLIQTSLLTRGTTTIVNFNLPIYSEGRQIQGNIIRLSQEEALMDIAATKRRLQIDLERAVETIRTNANLIQMAQIDVARAQSEFGFMQANRDTYSPDKQGTSSSNLSEQVMKLNHYKAEYLKAIATLKKLGVWEGNELMPGGAPTQQAAPTIRYASGPAVTYRVDVPQPIQYAAATVLDAFVPAQRPLDVLLPGQVIYPNDDLRLWVLSALPERGSQRRAQLVSTASDVPASAISQASMQLSGPLLRLTQMLINPQADINNRIEVLDILMNQYQGKEGFLTAIQLIAVHTPHQDIREQLFKFMVERDDHDLGFFIRVGEEAAKQNSEVAINENFRAIRQLLNTYPTVLNGLREANLDAPAATVRKVLVNYYLWEDQDVIAKRKLLQGFWDLDQLTQIHLDLRANGQPQAAKAYYEEILRRMAWFYIEEYFRRAEPSFMFWPADIRNSFLQPLMITWNHQFLSEFPNEESMRRFLPPDLLLAAKKGAANLMARYQGRSLPSIGVYANQNRLSPLNVDSLSVPQQEKYIATASLGYLKEMLYNSNSTVLGNVLSRMIKTREGRIAVLDVYRTATDSRLKELIAEREWEKILSDDLQEFQKSQKSQESYPYNDIIRDALFRMGQDVGSVKRKELLLNMRLQFFTVPGLHAADDPRGRIFVDAEIRRRSIRIAWDSLSETDKFMPMHYNGNPLYSSTERGLIRTIFEKTEENDPHAAAKFLDEVQQNRGWSFLRTLTFWKRDALDHIAGQSEKIEERIKSNDQNFPWFSWAGITLLLTLGTLSAWVIWKFIYRNYISIYWNRNMDSLREEVQWESIPHRLLPPKKPLWRSAVDRLKRKNDSAMVVDILAMSIPDNTDPRFKSALQRWERQLQELSRTSPSPEELVFGLNNILNQVALILGHTRYKPSLMFNKDTTNEIDNESYAKGFNYFNLIVIDTLSYLGDYIKENKRRLTQEQYQRLEKFFQLLLKITRYGVKYLRVLEARQNIDRIMGYKYANGTKREDLYVYPFIRGVLGYSFAWKRSEKILFNNLNELLTIGNELVPGLYPDDDAIKQESRELLGRVAVYADPLVSAGASISSGMEAKLRRFWGRLLLVGSPIVILLLMALGPHVGIFIGGLSTVGFIGFFLGLGNFWRENMNSLQMRRLRLTDRMISLWQQRSLIKIDDTTSLVPDDGQERLVDELDPSHDPRINMVILIPEHIRDRSSLESFKQRESGSLFRRDVPVDVMERQYDGSGNSYLDALIYAKNLMDKRGMDPNQTKVMFVFVAAGQSLDNVRRGVINGYRSAYTEPGRQHVIVYTRDRYVGPMKRPSSDVDINFLGVWINKDDSPEQRLLNIHSDEEGGEHVGEILERLDIGTLKGGRLRNELGSRYALDSPALKLPAFMGVMSFGPRIIRIIEIVARELQLNISLRRDLKYVHLTRDIVNIILNENNMNENSMREYVAKRIEWDDIRGHYGDMREGEIIELFKKFYAVVLLAKASDQLKADVFMSSPWQEVSFGENEDAAMLNQSLPLQKTGVAPGGVDLSATASNIEYKAKANTIPEDVAAASALPPITDFQGFEFQIIQYQPIDNAAQLFLSDAPGQPGPWFVHDSLPVDFIPVVALVRK